jgi:uncharacterized coiled-coil protein SlyX
VAVIEGHEPITEFSQWYVDYDPTGGRDGCLEYRGLSPKCDRLHRSYTTAKREMDARVADYDKLEKLADGEVVSTKPDLPNVSSGETAGLIRRTARNLVQNTPNVEIISKFNDDSVEGIFVRHVLLSKIVGTDQYSNDMQQNLFASTKSALTLGYDAVVPALMQDAAGSWYIKYDSLHYRDVFPEPGVKDVRDATFVFVRRYLTKGEVEALIRSESSVGWDKQALRELLKTNPGTRERQSVDHQTAKHRQVPEGYEIITWYSSSGDPFLTFHATTKMLLRIEKNKHPLKKHPVFFLVLEKDDQQPLGKSQVELMFGRQEFQDLMLNGAMKLWYRNINPSIIGYGAANAVPNLSPGKYTQISNPNAKIEAFEVNTQTLLQYGSISQQNLGSMVNLLGTADQQMATQAGNGMSATPQGVEAQTQMVDITTNNYQKAIEGFFSHYCSYALTIYFQELRSIQKVTPTAEARLKLLKAGLAERDGDEEGAEPNPRSVINPDGTIDIDFASLATEYWVRCVPGSLTEMEDEKQLRVLNELFIPLSQAMPALANTGDQQIIGQAAKAMSYIIERQIELSGAADALAIRDLWSGRKTGEEIDERDARIEALEMRVATPELEVERELTAAALVQLQEQLRVQGEALSAIMDRLGAHQGPYAGEQNNSGEAQPQGPRPEPTVLPASA